MADTETRLVARAARPGRRRARKRRRESATVLLAKATISASSSTANVGDLAGDPRLMRAASLPLPPVIRTEGLRRSLPQGRQRLSAAQEIEFPAAAGTRRARARTELLGCGAGVDADLSALLAVGDDDGHVLADIERAQRTAAHRERSHRLLLAAQRDGARASSSVQRERALASKDLRRARARRARSTAPEARRRDSL